MPVAGSDCKIEAVAAIPSILGGMKVATASAMIGAIVGEWFGAPSGLGVVVLNSMQNFQVPLLWATVMDIAAMTLAGFALLTLGERAARRRIGECEADHRPVARPAAVAVAGMGQCSGYNSIVLVPPGAVVSDLLHFPGAYLAPALHTLGFALVGLALGMAVGLLLALAAWLSELLAGITTPFALLLSSTPVVCLIPIIARLFGYDSRTELVAIAFMTFFLSFVYCCVGLRQLPRWHAMSSRYCMHHAGKRCACSHCPPRCRRWSRRCVWVRPSACWWHCSLNT